MTDGAGDGVRARVYELKTWAEEFDVECTLTLERDGRFHYDEYWTCYGAAVSGEVSGRWSREEGDVVVRHPDWAEGGTFLALRVGEERRGADRGDVLKFGAFELELRKEAPPAEPSRPAAPPPPPPPPPAPPPPPPTPPLAPPPADRAPQPASAATGSASAATGPPSPEREEARRRAGLRTPLPELAGHVRELVAQLPPAGLGQVGLRLGREYKMLPLASNSIYLWGLCPDGVMLCVDHESFAQGAEPEADPATAYAVMMKGVERYPELQPLVPERPPGVVRCGKCDGRGIIPAPAERIADVCLRCDGLGWHRSSAAEELEQPTRP
jgi:hypothetical protein